MPRLDDHDGLGLAIARAIVDGYGGSIGATNLTPRGTRIACGRRSLEFMPVLTVELATILVAEVWRDARFSMDCGDRSRRFQQSKPQLRPRAGEGAAAAAAAVESGD